MEEKTKYYAHAMKIDQETGKPMPKVFNVNGGRTLKLDTVINAMSVAGGGNTGDVDLGVTDESEIWLLFSIDKQPWRARGNSLTSQGTLSESIYTMYPRRNGETSVHSMGLPAMSIFVGLGGGGSRFPDYTNVDQARKLAIPFQGAKVNVYNDSTEVATVTVRVMRIWGGTL